MKIVFSRKGFDSVAGKAPSPIVEGRPVSLPIPASSSSTTYADLGLGELVETTTRGRVAAGDTCHHDPLFADDECIFGQAGAARSHLQRQGVGPGDLFLFFGVFADETTGERHHRFFGYLRVQATSTVAELDPVIRARLTALGHPHVFGENRGADVVFLGGGATAKSASPALRLTRPGGQVSRWLVPGWLGGKGLTYHARPGRWSTPGELAVVARGQEFVCDIGDDAVPRAWAEGIVAEIEK